jgi:hypothetical protein
MTAARLIEETSSRRLHGIGDAYSRFISSVLRTAGYARASQRSVAKRARLDQQDGAAWIASTYPVDATNHV